MVESGPKLLVVDDSLTVRTDLERALTGAGYGVTTCASVTEARAQLHSARFDLLILDVVLPDGDGIDLLKQVRAAPEHEGTPVILLSTEAEVKSRLLGLSTGADEYVGKPYDASFVIKRVRQLVDAPETAAGARPARGAGDKKILLLGAPSTFLSMLAERLRLDRHDVVIAPSDDEAQAMLSIDVIDCVVVDARDERVDGVALCRRINALPGREQIPVILLAAGEDPDLQARARDASIDDLVTDTRSVNAVRGRVRGLIEKKQREKIWLKATARISAAPSPTPEPGLFEQIMAASGLPPLIARSALSRACRRVDIDPHAMTPADLELALPAIREMLLVFLTTTETSQRIAAIATLARGSSTA